MRRALRHLVLGWLPAGAFWLGSGACVPARDPDYCGVEIRSSGRPDEAWRAWRTFDGAGRKRREVIDRDGRGTIDVTAYEYDARGRLILERLTHWHDGGGDQRVRYRYAAVGAAVREVEAPSGDWLPLAAPAPEPAWTARRDPPFAEVDDDGDGVPDVRVLSRHDARGNLLRQEIVDLRTAGWQRASFDYGCWSR